MSSRAPSEIPAPFQTTPVCFERERVIGRGETFTEARDAFRASVDQLAARGVEIDPSEGRPSAWEVRFARLDVTYCCVGYREPVRLRTKASNDA